MSWNIATTWGTHRHPGLGKSTMRSHNRWHAVVDDFRMPKMKKTLVLMSLLTVSLIWTASVWAAKEGGGESAKIGFSIQNYFSLEIKSGDTVDFGQVDAFGGPYIKKNGTKLKVDTNTTWSLAASKNVLLKPAEAAEGDVLDALTVSLETTKGAGSDNDIKVDYALDHLDKLPSGDYVIEVVFTGTAD